MDIKEAYGELKAIAPKGDYISIEYSMSRYSGGDEEIECIVYIERFAAPFISQTFRGALDQAREKLGLLIRDEPNIKA